MTRPHMGVLIENSEQPSGSEESPAPLDLPMQLFTAKVLRALILGVSLTAASAVTVNETSSLYTFANDRISFNILKRNGYIQNLVFEGVSVLGTVSGNAGQLYTG